MPLVRARCWGQHWSSGGKVQLGCSSPAGSVLAKPSEHNGLSEAGAALSLPARSQELPGHVLVGAQSIREGGAVKGREGNRSPRSRNLQERG